MRKWIVRGIVAVVVLGLLALVVWSFMPRAAAVDVAAARRGRLVVGIDGEGKTRVRERFVVTAPIGGNVQRSALNPADEVKRGQVVARLEPSTPPLLDVQSRSTAEARLRAAEDARRQAQAAVERSARAAELARKEFERVKVLEKGGAISRQERERVEFELRLRDAELSSARFAEDVAGHEIDAAKAALGWRTRPANEPAVLLEVTSPVDGRVLKVLKESEGVVAPGTPLLEIGDVRSLEIAADVLTRDAVSLVPGMRVRATRWGGDAELAGQVRVVEPAAFTKVSPLGVEEQRVNVVVDLDGDAKLPDRLGDGFAVDLQFVLADLPDALLVPASALVRAGEGWSVFVVEDSRARARSVKLGQGNALEVELKDGVREGEQVIAHPGELVVDGARVKPR